MAKQITFVRKRHRVNFMKSNLCPTLNATFLSDFVLFVPDKIPTFKNGATAKVHGTYLKDYKEVTLNFQLGAWGGHH